MSSAAVTSENSDATDHDLLTRYQRDRNHEAFAALVQRYSPMIMGVAERMLGCRHSAEDVTQATFLVLAKDARRIRRTRSVASWLYGVAYRIAARVASRRAREREPLAVEHLTCSDDPLTSLSDRYEQNTVFDEIHELSAKDRDAMILRYLKGKSNADVAEALGLSQSAVEGRLKRGRNQLRIRLIRKGVTFAVAIATMERARRLADAATTQAFTREVIASYQQPGNTEARDLAQDPTRLAQQEIVRMTMFTTLKTGVFTAAATGIIAAGWTIATSDVLVAQSSDPFAPVIAPSGTDKEFTDPFRTTIASSDSDSAREASQPKPDPFGESADGPSPLDPLGDETEKNDDAEKISEGMTQSHVKQFSPAEQRIYQVLRQPTKIDFFDETLADAISYLKQLHGLQIVIDTAGLEDEGLSSDVLLSGQLSGIKLSSVLRLLLEPLGLTTIVKDEVLMVTTETRAEAHQEIRVYRHNKAWQMSDEELAEIVQTAASPESWDKTGGLGSVSVIRGGIVVRQTQAVHDEIAQLLAQLERLNP